MIACSLQVTARMNSAAHMDPQKLLSWTDATQLKSFDNKLALKAEQDKAFVLNNAINAVKTDQEARYQRGLDQVKWRKARAACKQRLVAQRAKLPAASTARAAFKVFPAKNNRGGAGTCHVCTICGQPRKGTHGRTGCPNKK